MAVTIADLEVNIRDNGQSATLALNALINTLGKLASNIEPASKALKETTKELKTVEKTADKAASGGLGKFFKSIVRIAGYRAIRSALKMITSGFREGVQNIALYSQAIGGVDASKANEVMSAYASMGAQIKNSLGAAVMPLLANLLPWIQKVADAFMDLTEVVAKFFATLNGQATYTAANRDYWVDYAKGLDKSTGAAKELKRTILGFDEINALQKQSGGGSGSSAVDYGSMFVEKENTLLPYKDTNEWILVAVGSIATAIAAWRISKAFMSSLSSVNTLSGAIKNTLLGLAAIGIGIYLSWGAGESFAAGDIREGIIKSITGALSAALGGAMLGSFAGTGGAVVGAIIGVGISLVTTLISYFTNKAKIDKQEYWDNTISPFLRSLGISPDQYSEDAITGRMNANIELRAQISQISTEIDPKTLQTLEKARQLINDIFMLDEKKIKTKGEIEELKAKIQTLNNLSLDGIYLEWKEVEGVVGGTKEELLGVIDAMVETAKTQAKIRALENAYTAVFEATARWSDAVRRQRELEMAMTEAARQGNEKLAKSLQEQLSAQQSETFAFKATMIEAQDAYIKTMNAIDEKTKVSRDNIVDIADDVKDAYENATYGFVKAAEELEKAFNPNRIIKPSEWKKAIENAVGNISINFTASGNNLTPRIMTKASGGLVPTGDLFWAGERAPELIMSAPGGSEVVNMAQFQDAMVSAVMMAGGNGGGDWTIVVQDESGAVRSRQVITAAERANRRDGRTIVPVGVQ